MSDTDGKITWFEIPAGNTDRARSFYGGLFGWTFKPYDDTGNYQMTDSGGIHQSEKNGITVYFGTSDLDASIALIKSSAVAPTTPQEIPNVGRYATCTDTEGNAFGLFEATRPDRVDLRLPVGRSRRLRYAPAAKRYMVDS